MVDRSVTLRNGAKVDVGTAAGWLDVLRALAATHADHFLAVRAMASGRPAGVTAEVLAGLRDAGLMTATGELKDVVRDVFVSAYRPADEGDVLVSPFAPKSERERHLIRTNESRYDRRAEKLASDLDDQQGRGR